MTRTIFLIIFTVGCQGTAGPSAVAGGSTDTTGSSHDDGDAHTSGGGTASDDGDGSDGSDDGDDGDASTDELPFDPEQLARVCARGNEDRIAQALCGGAEISGLADVLASIEFKRPFHAMTGNSSSLVARYTSALNPRLIVGEADLGSAPGLDEVAAMGFVRGEQFVELVGYDAGRDDLNFYLLMFEQACNETPAGCGLADLLTPQIEDGWTRWTLYQDVDLVNKTVDCLVCHQPLGPETPKILRMQELQNPWLHWFPGGVMTAGVLPEDPQFATLSGEKLTPSFTRMHGADGTYGGVAIDELLLANSGPDLETLVTSYLAGRALPAELQLLRPEFFVQSAAIELQVFATGTSPEWEDAYADVIAGERLPLPSYRVDVTDDASREAAIESYLAVTSGAAPPDSLIDPRSAISDDALVQLSLRPRADASAEEILSSMCARCHNGRLDPELSRARFDATALADVSNATKANIADRVVRHHDDRWLMPPERFGTLPDWAIERVLAWAETP